MVAARRTLAELDAERYARKEGAPAVLDVSRPLPPSPTPAQAFKEHTHAPRREQRPQRKPAALALSKAEEIAKFERDPVGYLRRRFVDEEASRVTLALDLGISHQRVHQILRQHKIERERPASRSLRAVALVRRGLTIREASEQMGIQPYTVQVAIKAHAPEIDRRLVIPTRDRERPSNEWLRQKYVVEGIGAPTIARERGVHQGAVWYWLDRAGIKPRKKSQRTSHVTEAWLRQRYIDEGRSTGQIAAELGVSAGRVHQLLKKFGIRKG